ncbi:MAG: hypothetical protein NTX00_00070 [Candidatus Parcubacteria bacterium]|nr:hypothetical protein [Candidatus Parcubacteria bacterium]
MGEMIGLLIVGAFLCAIALGLAAWYCSLFAAIGAIIGIIKSLLCYKNERRFNLGLNLHNSITSALNFSQYLFGAIVVTALVIAPLAALNYRYNLEHPYSYSYATKVYHKAVYCKVGSFYHQDEWNNELEAMCLDGWDIDEAKEELKNQDLGRRCIAESNAKAEITKANCKAAAVNNRDERLESMCNHGWEIEAAKQELKHEDIFRQSMVAKAP